MPTLVCICAEPDTLFSYLEKYPNDGITFGNGTKLADGTVINKPDSLDYVALADADLGNDIDTRRSIAGQVHFFNGGPIYSSSKMINSKVDPNNTKLENRVNDPEGTCYISTMGSELFAVSEASLKTQEFRALINEMARPFKQTFLNTPTRVFTDNKSTQITVVNEGHTKKSKHLSIRRAAVHEQVKLKNIVVQHVDGIYNIADIFTKALPKARFHEIRKLLVSTEISPIGA